VRRYKRRYFIASGSMADAIESESLEHADEERARRRAFDANGRCVVAACAAPTGRAGRYNHP